MYLLLDANVTAGYYLSRYYNNGVLSLLSLI